MLSVETVSVHELSLLAEPSADDLLNADVRGPQADRELAEPVVNGRWHQAPLLAHRRAGEHQHQHEEELLHVCLVLPDPRDDVTDSGRASISHSRFSMAPSM